ncbi:hypothetical protein QHH03_32350, partial [Aphanizomenon sp. 202]|nr:hypothetical protein [Aphanizomenon sp. 202]
FIGVNLGYRWLICWLPHPPENDSVAGRKPYFRANSESKLKFTQKFSGYLVINRQLLLLDWEYG